jgi:multidrug efflux system membrane fusion protein|nr:efflux RND transporter periplasmic adaptor subunit [Kofleriaceae bacterium]
MEHLDEPGATQGPAHAQPSEPIAVPKPHSRAGSLAIRIGIAAVVVGGFAYWLHTRGNHGGKDKQVAAGGSGGSGRAHGDSSGASGAAGGSADRVVPVTVVTAEKKDVPIWLEGLGSVAAVQQVTVHVQVDGRLDRVAFTEGQYVKKGDVLAQVDPRPFQVALESAEGALVRDKAQLVMNQQNLNRYKGLQDQKLVAAQEVEQYAGAVGQFEGAIKVDQAAIDQARLNLDYAQVKSPLDGITGVRLVDAGNIVHATDAGGLVVITAIDPAAVYFTVPEDKLQGVLDAQQRGEVSVKVSSRDGSHDLGDGTLAVLDNQVNQTTATLRLKALVPNPKHLLWPSAFVKARMLVETRPGAIVVPAVAIQQGPTGGQFVYVVKDDAANMTAVTVGLITGDTAIIDKGINPGDQIVVEGQNQLRNGGRVSIDNKNAGSGAAGSAAEAGSAAGGHHHGSGASAAP